MMKMSCIFLFIAALPSLVIAQSNYKTGYVLKNNGDTLKGYINYKEWTQCPLSIDFKIDKGDKKSLEFNPRNIKGFYVDGLDTYISYRGQISMNHTEFQDLPSFIDTNKKNDTVFLQRVTTGKYLTFYYQADNFKQRLFIAEANSQPLELKYFPYVNATGQVMSSNIYKGQLTFYIKKYAPGNESLVNKVERISYQPDDITPIIDKINPNTTTIKKISPIRLFAGIDMNATTNQITITKSSEIVKTQGTVLPMFNLGLDLFNNPNVQQFIFRAQLSFFYTNPQIHFSDSENTNIGSHTYSFNYYTFNQYTAAITPQLLFNVFNKENFKIHLGVGAAFYFSAYSNNKLETQNVDGSIASGSTIKNPYTLESLWFNTPTQLGTTINKRIEIDFTYFGYTAFTNNPNFTVATRSFGLGLKYLFSRH